MLVNRAGRVLENLSVDIDSGLADLAPSVWSLANPDLMQRLKEGAPLNEADPATFFGGGSKGYTDYPTLKELEHQKG